MWLVLALVGTLFVYLVARRWSLYVRLYSPAFVRALQAGIERAKASALAAVGREVKPEELLASGSAFVTPSGLAFVYTISEHGAGAVPGQPGAEADSGPHVRHVVSLSYRGGFFARSAAAFVAAMLRRLLLTPQTDTTLSLAESGVYYFVFNLSPEAQAEYAARPVTAVPDAEVRGFISACAQERDAMARGRGLQSGAQKDG